MVVFLGMVASASNVQNPFNTATITICRAQYTIINNIYTNSYFGANHSSITWQLLDGSPYTPPFDPPPQTS